MSPPVESVRHRDSLPLGAVLLLVLGLCISAAAISPSGSGFVLRLAAAVLVLFGFGQIVLWLLLGRASLEPETLLLALPAGVIVFAGIAQVANNLGLRLTHWLFPAAAVLAVPGCAAAWTALRGRLRASVRHGWLYVGAIAVIWLIYYLPGSQLDSVRTGDGGVKWWYADSFFHQAMIVELDNSLAWNDFPPRTPGFCRLPLCYQYGSHAIAAQMMYWLGMTADDVAARGLPWIGLLALVGATICAGRRMAIQPGRESLAGLLALALVFLLPGLQAVYANNVDSSFRHSIIVVPSRWEAIATNLLDPCYGFSSGSIVWTCVAAFTVLALLAQEGAARQAEARSRAVVVLATAAIGLNSVAALCCWGIGACYGLVYARRRWSTCALLLAAGVGFVLWFRLSGFDFSSGSHMTMQASQETSAYARVYGLVKNVATLAANAAFLLLGFRLLAILSLAWGRREVKTSFLLFVGVYSSVLITLTLLNYPLIYLGKVLCVFAAGPAAEIVVHLGTGSALAKRLWTDACRVFRNYSAGVWLLSAAALAPTLVTILRRRSLHDLPHFSQVLLVGFALISLAYLAFRWLDQSRWQPSRGQFLLFAGVLSAACFVGVLRDALTFAANWGDSVIVLDAGRARSLRFVHDELPNHVVLATARHDVPTREVRERSLMYSAVSGRRILLEGWRYMTPMGSPEFEGIRQDNATLFSTHDPRKARQIVEKYGITHILLEPEQTLGFALAAVPWLKRLESPGSLGVLAVEGSGDRRLPEASK